jgi:hypothetical protein
MTPHGQAATHANLTRCRYAEKDYMAAATWFWHILFTQKVELSVAKGRSLPDIHNPFWIIPTLNGGNLDFRISENDPSDLTAPITDQEAWTVFNASINSDFGLSLVLKHRTGALLQLTSTSEAEPTRTSHMSPHAWLSGDWVSDRKNEIISGQWTFKFLPDLPSDGSRLFFWSFLIQPPKQEKEDPFTVTFPFSLLGTNGELEFRQVGESFPPGWRAKQIKFPPDGLEMIIVQKKTQEQYWLRTGRFSGGLGHLVCQGNIPPQKSTGTDAQPNIGVPQQAADGTPPEADGNWTGTSGGP